ncbi:MAG: hypothetical protein ABIE36_00760 [Candidatus Diapherotrites archaeon]
METQFPGGNSLEGDFRKRFLENYRGVVKSNYKNNLNLKVSGFRDNLVMGLNSYSLVLVNNLLEKEGLRTLAPVDIPNINDRDKNLLKGFDINFGLVLSVEKYANGYLAKQLAKQVKERKYEFSSDNPLVFKPSDLELIFDRRSSSGLGFKIKESANLFNAPELSFKNNKRKFNNINDKWSPIFDENGSGTLYARENGLFRLDLSKYGDLCSWNNNLVTSDTGNLLVALNDSN